MHELERRSLEGLESLECRAEGEPLISGYFAKYGVISSPIQGVFKEELTGGVSKRSLAGIRDIKALYHHDMKDILGSTTARTLRLTEDGVGLRGDLNPAQTSVGKDVVINMRAGNIRGASIGFKDVKGAIKWRQENGWDVRSVSDYDLREVTITGFPIYESAQLSVRSYLSKIDDRDHMALICRAVNRIENKLDVIDEDKDILREYRSQLEEMLPPEMRAMVDSLLEPKREIVISPAGLLDWLDTRLISIDGLV